MGFLRDLVVRIKGDKTQLDSTLKGAESSVNNFGSVLKKVGGLLGVAFGVHEIVAFSKEAVKLAAEAEGVKNAFMKIGDAKGVLESMKRATRGVIEESDLMQLAVKAQNFNIPLKDLSTYLQFATNRAITTGKSVGELADLIVTGLGRKSSRSFIQLGLSAKEVQEAFKSTHGVFDLVTASLKKMGDVEDTASIRYGQMAANVKNLKEAWGEFLNNSKLVQGSIGATTLALDKLATKIPWYTKLWYAFRASVLGTPGIIQNEIDNIPGAKNMGNLPKDLLTMVGPPSVEKGEPIVIDPEEAKKEAEALAKLKKEIDVNYAHQGSLLFNAGESVGKNKAGNVMVQGPNANPAHYGIGSAQWKVAEIDAGNAMADSEAKTQKWADDMDSILKDANANIVSLGVDIIEGLGEALGGGRTLDIGRSLLMSLSGFLAQFGKMLITLAIGEMAFMKSLKDPALWPVALAAGIAMTLAAGAIKGLMSGGLSGSGSSGGGTSSGSSLRTQRIEVYGKIQGKDIVIAQKRYYEDNA
jgi:hypothetical protein